MANIIIRDIFYTESDHTYYLSNSSCYQHLASGTIEGTIKNLEENGFQKSFSVQRADYTIINSWWNGHVGIAFWDNDLLPSK